MVESAAIRLLLDGSIALVIVASIVEVYADVSSGPVPEFLPAPLSGLPPCDPATALATAGGGGLVLGVALTLNPLPGGRLLVGVIAVIAFLFSGGFIVGSEETDGGSYHG
jgi:hypothetical protein